ncbi:DM13 domain-containing protein [Foetidibacter luteolus]|uniref:DM13 domain-containing protein n=1 Tax=Foetidibacter luteolus TaxID=2608880 RepID=UPI001A99D741|nr:DM13 domain-containing protein [Foetidibacter luteolus]
MKYLLTAALCLLLAAACKKESTPATPLDENADTTAILKDSGSFVNGPYGVVSGTAKIYKSAGKYQLSLENFTSTNGPDLKVYLSKEIQPVNFVNLGSLKSTSGNQLYNIPAGVAVADYKYALIHCQQYNHLFGYAERK